MFIKLPFIIHIKKLNVTGQQDLQRGVKIWRCRTVRPHCHTEDLHMCSLSSKSSTLAHYLNQIMKKLTHAMQNPSAQRTFLVCGWTERNRAKKNGWGDNGSHKCLLRCKNWRATNDQSGRMESWPPCLSPMSLQQWPDWRVILIQMSLSVWKKKKILLK